MVLRRRLALLVLIVQDRRVLVERDDVGVGQLALRMSRGAHVRHVNLVLRLAGAERGFRGDVSARSGVRRVAHALELIVGLDCARVVQPVQQLLADCARAKPQSANCCLPFADERAAAQRA